MNPKVTIVVPVYNVAAYVAKCLKTICRQTLTEIEIIVVNDGSTDRSMKAVARFAARDPRIKIVNQQNQGLGFARNAGLDIARGEYICFIDSDDWLDRGFAKAFYLEAKRTKADVVVGTYYEASSNERSIIPYYVEPALRYCDTPFTWREQRSVLLLPTPVWDNLYRLQFLRDHKIRFTKENAEDIPFKWRTFTSATRMSVVPEPFYYYRVRASSLTGGRQLGIEAFRSHDLARDYLFHAGLYDEVYPEWVVREVVEVLYITFKARQALINDKFFFTAFYNLMRKVLTALDLDRARGLLAYIPEEYLFRATFVREQDNPEAFRTMLVKSPDVIGRAGKRPFKLAGREITIEYRRDGETDAPSGGGSDEPFFALVSGSTCHPVYYPGETIHRAAYVSGGNVTMLPPTFKESGPPAVATLTVKRGHGLHRIWFLAFAFQPERKHALQVRAAIGAPGDSTNLVSTSLDLACGAAPRQVSIDLPEQVLESSFELRLSVETLDGHPAFYTGTRLFKFYAA